MATPELAFHKHIQALNCEQCPMRHLYDEFAKSHPQALCLCDAFYIEEDE